MSNTKEQFASASKELKQPNMNQMVMNLIKNNLVSHSLRTDTQTGDKYE